MHVYMYVCVPLRFVRLHMLSFVCHLLAKLGLGGGGALGPVVVSVVNMAINYPHCIYICVCVC